MGYFQVLFRLASVFVLAAFLVNCAKSKTGSTATPSIASNVAGQTITCPISGYYLFNGVNYACTPGQTITVGANVPTPTPVPAPSPIPVTPAPVPVPTDVPPQNSCDAYTAQYGGVLYVVAFYQGAYVCMREDIATYYGLAVY